MANDLQNRLDDIARKCRFLTERFNVVKTQRDRANDRVEELQKMLYERDAQIERLQRQVDFLQVSGAIAPDRQTARRARAMVAGLLRDVDRCLAELNE